MSQPAGAVQQPEQMTGLRRLGIVALGLAYIHIIFGAVVRISGSGLGCGNHWPDCNGTVVPDFATYRVIIEYTHRLLAGTLLSVVVIFAIVAFLRRHSAGVGGKGGVLRSAVLAVALVIAAALVGMVVVKMDLRDPHVIVVHYAIAMATLATLVIAVQRAGGLWATHVSHGTGSAKTFRGATAAAVLAFITVVMGALTANVPGAAFSCQGFPWCRIAMSNPGHSLYVQITHRVLAFLLFFHLMGLMIGVTKRREAASLVSAARWSFRIVALQVIIAAVLVELRLPHPVQSLHQAVGTLLWIVTFTFAALARRAVPAA